MIDWLTGWFLRVGGGIAHDVVDLVHWAVHALASVVLAVFDHVFNAWRHLVLAYIHFISGLARVIIALGGKLLHVVRVLIPRIYAWAHNWIVFLLKLIRSWVAWLWKQIRATIALLYQQIGAVIRWAWTHIFEPLWRWAQFLWHLMRAWAFVAWWWITHLAALAEAMLFHLVASLEKHAWEVAPLLGRFLLALIIRNLTRFVRLVEQIIAAVL